MKNETARREIELLDYYLQNHTNDYSEKSHTAMMMAIKALEQEPCEDCISRQAVLDAFWKLNIELRPNAIDAILNMVNDMPSVTPAEKVGHWIEQIDHEKNCRTLICSNCDRPALHDGDSIWKHKFCPNCGAKMVEPQERSDKE